MGFQDPKWQERERSSIGLHHHLSTCTQYRAREVTGGSHRGWGKRAAGNLERSRPLGGSAAGGRGRCTEETEEGDRESARTAGAPSSDHTEAADTGKGGCHEREADRTYSTVFLREEVGAVVQAFLLVRRANSASEEEMMGETQRETLEPDRRGPRSLPAPAAPAARPVLSSAENTHHHGCSASRASAGALVPQPEQWAGWGPNLGAGSLLVPPRSPGARVPERKTADPAPKVEVSISRRARGPDRSMELGGCSGLACCHPETAEGLPGCCPIPLPCGLHKETFPAPWRNHSKSSSLCFEPQDN